MRTLGGYFDQAETHGLTLKRRCELLEVGRWTAYKKPHEPNVEAVEREETLKRRIDYWHTKQPCSGVRKLRKLLREHDGLVAGRKLIKRLMEEMGIHTIYPKPNLSKPSKEQEVPVSIEK